SWARHTPMQGNLAVGGTSWALFDAFQGYRADRSGTHGDALDPRRRRSEDVELEPVEREPLPRPRNAAQRGHQQARGGLDPRDVEGHAKGLFEPAGGSAALELHDAGRRLGG